MLQGACSSLPLQGLGQRLQLRVSGPTADPCMVTGCSVVLIPKYWLICKNLGTLCTHLQLAGVREDSLHLPGKLHMREVLVVIVRNSKARIAVKLQLISCNRLDGLR